MVNNFWSFNYIAGRFMEKAEEHGIEVEERSEYKTSSKCPLCHSEDIATRGRLFKCLSCGLEANRDAVGVPNIGHLHEAALTGGHTPASKVEWNEVEA